MATKHGMRRGAERGLTGRWRWVLVAVVPAAALAGWIAGSCTIDDEVTWISDPQCTGTCRSADPGSLTCDVDSSCTPTADCPDWDCSEAVPANDGGDGDADVGGAPDGYAGDAGSGSDVPATGLECTPTGGGLARDAAQTITLDATVSGLIGCPLTSQWFRFDAAAGAQFTVDLQPLDGGQLTFLLYAGDDPTPVAAADMTDSGTYGAMARANTTYYLRIRSVGETTAGYSLTVSEVTP